MENRARTIGEGYYGAKEKAGCSRREKEIEMLSGRKEDTRWSGAKERRRGTNGERTKEGRKTNRQADSRVHRARVLLAIRALDETRGPSAAAAAAPCRTAAVSPALAHAGPADL